MPDLEEGHEPPKVVAASPGWTIRGGIEFPPNDAAHVEYEPQCARCGSSAAHVSCYNCAGDGYSHHDCGEDTCCCLHPEDNVVCDVCDGDGGWWACTATPQYCASIPMPGRESIESTAMSSQGWLDAE